LRAKLSVPKPRRGRVAGGALRMAIGASAIGLSVGCALAGSAPGRAMAPHAQLKFVNAVEVSTAPGVAGSRAAPRGAAAADNPLGLPVAPTNGDPLSGARFFVDHENEASVAARRYPQLRLIADQPGTVRFGAFSGPDVGRAVHDYLVRASREEPGTVPLLATYRIVDGHCGNWTPTPGDQDSYHAFISRFARGVGRHRAVLFLEMDSLITAPCLSRKGVSVRMHELQGAINVLIADCPRLVIYLDAGAADALSAPHAARLLRRAGVGKIQGFFLNSTHFDWTSNEIRFGDQVSRLTGGKHFVINTGENGRGPLVPPDRVHQGNEVLCNPAGRGLGPRPTTNTGYPTVDAFAWTSNPGESGGACVPGAPPTGAFWPAYALMLVGNAHFTVDSHFNRTSTSANGTRRRKRSHKRVRRHVVKHHRVHRHHRHVRRGT
jgi:endoglucanase